MERVSITVGTDQIVDELIISFTHEPIYRDQSPVLFQIDLLDPSYLRVIGADGAERIINPKQSNQT